MYLMQYRFVTRSYKQQNRANKFFSFAWNYWKTVALSLTCFNAMHITDAYLYPFHYRVLSYPAAGWDLDCRVLETRGE